MKKTLLFIFSLSIIISCTKKKKDSETTSTTDTLAIYNWTTEACEFNGEYNPQVVSEEQLNNTYELWFATPMLMTDATVFEPEEIKKLSIDTLNKEYNEKMARLKSMQIISNPFWEKLKQEVIQEIEEDYQLKKITIEAYSNPSILLNNSYSKYCNEYAKVLASDNADELMKAWKKLAEERKVKSKSPNDIIEYNQKHTSKDRIMIAKVYLMGFGWWNCANTYIHRVNRDSTYEQEFNKLFKNMKSECYEP